MDTARTYATRGVMTLFYITALLTVYLPFALAELLHEYINKLVEWMDDSPWFEGFTEPLRYFRNNSFFGENDGRD